MGIYLGLDTSNYTTSAALYDSKNGVVFSERKLLPVREGELGLRQSDAVFHHTVQLPEVAGRLLSPIESGSIAAVGASVRPRDVDGSYMPCFLVGKGTAQCVAAACFVSAYEFSHQCGHIAAVIYASGRYELFNSKFIAFHVSGGTTEAVLVEPDSEKIIKCTLLLSSLDLKAGQAVDRVGNMLSLPFPSGKYIDELACKSSREYKINIKLKDGCCSLSGLENQCEKMKKSGESDCDISRYCIEYIACALDKMAMYALEKYGDVPLVFSGGVMSNSIISDRFTQKYGAVFAPAEFSSDNAAGIAVLTALSHERKERMAK